MQIRMRYFASVREITGQNEELFTLVETSTVAQVRGLLLANYPRLETGLARADPAINHQYVNAETLLKEGDELVFIPPVGGGAAPLSYKKA